MSNSRRELWVPAGVVAVCATGETRYPAAKEALELPNTTCHGSFDSQLLQYRSSQTALGSRSSQPTIYDTKHRFA